MPAFTYPVERRPDGALAPGAPTRAAGLNAASAAIPDGGYTTLRTYGKSGVIVLPHHFDRLEESAALLGCPVQLERDALRRLLCELLSQTPWAESRVRITVDCTARPGDLWVSVEPLETPHPDLYETGVACMTRVMQRENPKAKYTRFIRDSHAEREALRGEIHEILMVSEKGAILEGLSSNFFAFYRGLLYTADEGVLHGITRTLILDEAARAGIPVRLEAPRLEWLAEVEEAFISSASRALLPVTRIDDSAVGDGTPGAVSRLLLARYQARLETEIEELCR